jgi:hypothetical protein
MRGFVTKRNQGFVLHPIIGCKFLLFSQLLHFCDIGAFWP